MVHMFAACMYYIRFLVICTEHLQDYAFVIQGHP